jgi:hypothetical protein
LSFGNIAVVFKSILPTRRIIEVREEISRQIFQENCRNESDDESGMSLTMNRVGMETFGIENAS